MISKYKVTGKLRLDASRHDSVIVKANTLKKALKYGEEALRKKHNMKSMLDVTELRAEIINDNE